MSWLAIALMGCGEPVPVETAADTDMTEAPWEGPPQDPPGSDPGTDPCATPIALAPLTPGVLALEGTRFVATGGSGTFTFAMDAAPSGGIVSEAGGSYVAGPVAGVTDRVRVDDAGCGTSATADVTVYHGMAVSPTEAQLLPGSSFTVEVTGGSGAWRCEASILASGGSLSGCDYTAGVAGADLLAVVDELTGERVELAYDVDPDATLTVWGGVQLLPIGQRVRPTWAGGSGHLDVTVTAGPGAVVNEDGWLTGTAPGAFTLDVRDRFTDLAVTVTGAVGSVHAPDVAPDGERQNWGKIVPLGDLDGDGRDDFAVGVAEAGVGAWRSGAVYVYRGGETEPHQVLTWPEEAAWAGRGLLAADFDGDGRSELAIGIEAADGTATDSGVVLVHRWDDALGAFDAHPLRVMEGLGFDRMGYSLAACDVDADGFTDLVAGGTNMDLPGTAIYDTGGFRVFRGSLSGLLETAAWSVTGRVPVAGVFADTGSFALGRDLATGDWNGDGRCDVAASQLTWALAGTGQTGGVLIYDGVAIASGAAPLDPIRVLTADPGADASAQLGREIAMADLDGDGRDDVLSGAWQLSDTPGDATGAVFAWLAADDAGGPAAVPVTDWTWKIAGNSAFDYLGIGLEAGDVTGDGAPDVVVGAASDEVDGGVDSTGTVRVVDGAALRALPHGSIVTLADPAVVRSVAGPATNAWFGAAVGLVGDVDADGTVDLAALASRESAWGTETGAPWVIPGDPALPPERLGMPVASAGAGMGEAGSFALVDADGDGARDLVAGARGAGLPAVGSTLGPNTGDVLTYPWTGPGFATTAADGMAGAWSTQGGFEAYGYAVAPAGDFDGDGWDDLAVVSSTDGVPSSLDALVYDVGGCPLNIGGTGAVWVHRGGPDGVAEKASFVAHGYGSGDRIESVAADLDHDGDGYGDLALGSSGSGSPDYGGVSILYGRPAPADGRIAVLCDQEDLLGANASSALGISVASAGDVDGDGCDEVAAGADAEDILGLSNVGSVRVFWGWGPGCRAAPVMTTVYDPTDTGARAGRSVAGGRDATGDGVPDLLVGAWDAGAGSSSELGAMYLVSGATLLGMPTSPATAILPLDTATALSTMSTRVTGAADDADFGWSVALVPGADRAYAAVGAPLASTSGAARTGGVWIYDAAGGVFGAEPIAVVLGETSAERSKLGSALWAGEGWLLVGAPMSDQGGLDDGAIYAFPVGF